MLNKTILMLPKLCELRQKWEEKKNKYITKEYVFLLTFELLSLEALLANRERSCTCSHSVDLRDIDVENLRTKDPASVCNFP